MNGKRSLAGSVQLRWPQVGDGCVYFALRKREEKLTAESSASIVIVLAGLLAGHALSHEPVPVLTVAARSAHGSARRSDGRKRFRAVFKGFSPLDAHKDRVQLQQVPDIAPSHL